MNRYKVLVVDDDEFVCEDIATSLDSRLFNVDKADCGNSAFTLFKQKQHEIVITDLKMAENEDDGFKLIKNIKTISSDTAIMIITSHRDFQKAVKAIRLGAIDFITKPYESEQIAIRIEKISEHLSLKRNNIRLCNEIVSQHKIIGNSPAILNLHNQIVMIAKTDCTVFISGPNGSGKELVAWSIRNHSKRINNPFVIVNCATLPENLIEAELFGTVKGAFSGSVNKKGKFELADGGTLFLDEVGDLSLEAQAKLLRVIEYGDCTRVGGTETIKLDVRLISATNKDLSRMIDENKFRRDLYDRLMVIPVKTIPLSQIREDIPILIDHFLKSKGSTIGLNDILSKEALSYLQTLQWPGNVRELHNIIERLLIFSGGTPCDVDTLKLHINTIPIINPFKEQDCKTLKDATEAFERSFILSTLLKSGNNKTAAAKQLGITREYLYEKMKKLGISR